MTEPVIVKPDILEIGFPKPYVMTQKEFDEFATALNEQVKSEQQQEFDEQTKREEAPEPCSEMEKFSEIDIPKPYVMTQKEMEEFVIAINEQSKREQQPKWEAADKTYCSEMADLNAMDDGHNQWPAVGSTKTQSRFSSFFDKITYSTDKK